MPTSALPKRSTDRHSAPRRLRYLWLVLLVVIAVLVVLLIALPASIMKRFLPPTMVAEDFSGTVWHGSVGKIIVNGRDAGAVEWRIHPESLFALELAADIHWVKIGFVADASMTVDRHTLSARDVVGGGPIQDLADCGIAVGWHGTSHFDLSELKLGFGAATGDAITLLALAGELSVADLDSPQIGAGTDLGGYDVHLANGPTAPDMGPTAQITDTGGPLEVRAVMRFSARDRTGLFSGTIRERPAAPAALRSQLENLSQMHARDAQGRIPVELEFTL